MVAAHNREIEDIDVFDSLSFLQATFQFSSLLDATLFILMGFSVIVSLSFRMTPPPIAPGTLASIIVTSARLLFSPSTLGLFLL